MKYDLIVIGSGPAGQKAAIAAAKQNRRVAIVERAKEMLGGVCLHTGTIPSKTIREAILHLTGYRQRDVYEELYRRKRDITMDELRRKMARVSQNEWQVVQDQFARNLRPRDRRRRIVRRSRTPSKSPTATASTHSPAPTS